MNNKYICQRCKGEIKRIVETCQTCLKDFHPSCTKEHKIFNTAGEKVLCKGNCELFNRSVIGDKYYRRSRRWNEDYDAEELNPEIDTTSNDNNINSDIDNDIMTAETRQYTCARCKSTICRMATSCKLCHKDFHPACADKYVHKVYNLKNELVRCVGLYETIDLQNIKGSSTTECIQLKDNTQILNSETNPADTSHNNNFSEEFEHQTISIFNEIDNINADNITELKQTLKKQIFEHMQKIQTVLYEKLKQDFNTFSEKFIEKFESLKLTDTTNQSEKQVNNNSTNNLNTNAIINQTSQITDIERIIIQPKTAAPFKESIREITNNIDVVNLGINVKKILPKPNGNIIIDVAKTSDKHKLTEEIYRQFGDTYKVKKWNQYQPKIKIIGLDEAILQLNDDILISNLMTQNNWSSTNNNCLDSSIKVLKKYKTSRYCSIILQVNTSLHESILNNGKIRYGWNSYKVYNHISVIRCYKCWGLNHTANRCTKDEKCRKCAEHHHENQCNSLVNKCVNCIELVNKQKDENIDVHHEATNLKCEFFQKYLQKRLTNITNNRK